MFVDNFWMLILMLVFGHALADYPLQGDFLANAKNKNSDLGKLFWKHALFSHSVIHGGFVALFTGYWFLGIFEAIIHAYTDHLKCMGRITLNMDQAIHLACKVLWAVIAFAIYTNS